MSDTGAPRLVTCIIPVHNGARHLRDALGSALSQQWPHLEIVAVNDGSTDDSEAILRSYGSRVRVVSQSRSGPAAARNTGVRAAGGDYLAFLDQDDWWPADKLAVQMAHFARKPDLDVSVGHVQSVWEAGPASRVANQPRTGRVPGYVPGALLAHRSAFDRVGAFDETLWFVDGLDWFARARELGVVVELLRDVVLFHRVHGDNLSRRGEESRREALEVLRRSLARQRAQQGPEG